MKFFIPTIGTKIRLIYKWEFRLFKERRNRTLLQAKKLIDPELPYYYPLYSETNGYHLTSLPEGSVLTVDRIYVRKGAPEYDSVSFVLQAKSAGYTGRIRFWVKLKDLDEMEFELV
jgi:hypothetical protein